MRLEDEIKQAEFRNPYEKALVNVIYTGNWMVYEANGLLRPYGISTQQYNVLRILRGQHPGCASIGLIKERMLDKNSDTSRIITRLVEKELIERRPNDTDRRQIDVSITAKGLDLLVEIDQSMGQVLQKLAHMSLSDINTLNELLDRLRNNSYVASCD